MYSNQKNLMKWLEGNRPFSVREAEEDGISRGELAYFCRLGKLERLERGIYLPVNALVNQYYSLQTTSLKEPSCVVCLISALRFHNFTTQISPDVWIAIRQHSHIPVWHDSMHRITMLSDRTFEYGIEEHDIEGVKIRVYSAAKTVADCFQFRNRIGLDVAMEALRDGYRKKLFTISELMAAAKVCRVARIITPYAECLFYE